MKMRMGRQRISALFIAMTLLLPGRQTLCQVLQYSLDLQKNGCPLLPPPRFTRESELWAITRHVSFDGKGRLYVGCAIQGNAALVKPGEANNIFRVLTIEAENGTVIRRLDFPTVSKGRVGVNIAADDGLLVTANDKVQRVGEDGSVLATFSIPIDGKTQFLRIEESASGQTLLVAADTYALDFIPVYFFHADTLASITQCQIPFSSYRRDYPATIADHVQMKDFQNTFVEGGPPIVDRLVIGPFCGEMKDLWPVKRGVGAVLLDDSTVLEKGRSDQDTYTSVFEVRKTNGDALWADTLPKHFLEGGEIDITRDRSRFAIEIQQLRGGHPALAGC